MLQTQIRLLKNIGAEIPLEEREALVEQDQQLVDGVFNEFLTLASRSLTLLRSTRKRRPIRPPFRLTCSSRAYLNGIFELEIEAHVLLGRVLTS